MAKALCRASYFSQTIYILTLGTLQVFNAHTQVPRIGAKIKREAETSSFQLNKKSNAMRLWGSQNRLFSFIFLTATEKQKDLVSQASWDFSSMGPAQASKFLVEVMANV